MSRQLELDIEVRDRKRRDDVYMVIEFGLAGALESRGIVLLGLAIKHDAWDCLMTIKADLDGVRHVAFVGSDTLPNTFLKAYGMAKSDRLRWRTDKYKKKKT